jgi:imidazolonepropionase-like amidohydrolase
MRIAAILALVLWAATPAHAGTEEFSIIIGSNRVGHVTTTTQGDQVSIVFDIKDNGRGPTIAEVLRLDAQGLPISWAVTGATTFGNKVDEAYALADGQARWKDSSGEGSQALAQPRMYVTQNGSPWALGFYARALLAAPERRMPVLPAGELALEEGKPLQVSDGKGTRTVRQFAISGIELDPSYLLLDEADALFAVISPGFIVIRRGYEGEEVRLRKLAADLGEQRLKEIQARTAHNYGAPVRIRNVRVFNPASGALGEPVSVLVNGRHITSVQPLDAAATPGEVLIEGEGGTLVPGLFEMHAHTGQDDAILNIAAGVTSFRDMGNDNAVLDDLIASIEAGTVAGPRITRSGFIEGKSPFNSNNGILVSSQAEALAAVRWYAARGYNQVKLYNSMNPAWSAAAVKEAHRLGLRASGHIPAFSNADAMIAAGYDELTHINQIMLGWVLTPEEDTRTLLRLTALKRLAELDLASPRVRTTMDSIVAKKVAVEPTIAIHENLLLNQNGQVPRGMADYIGNLPVGVQRDAKQAWSDMSAPGDAAAYAAAFEKLMATLREMRERGVLLIPGTDLGGSFTYHRELQLFEQLGYTPSEVLSRATLDMAKYLGQDQSLGSIERGKLADFFLVAGDPTAELAQIKKIRMVVKDGTVYYPSEIHPHFGIKPSATAPVVTLPEAAAN